MSHQTQWYPFIAKGLPGGNLVKCHAAEEDCKQQAYKQ